MISDYHCYYIKLVQKIDQIKEAEDINKQAEITLSELKLRETEVEKEIEKLKLDSQDKIKKLEEISSKKLSEQIEKRKLVAENKIDQFVRETNISVKNHITNAAMQATTKILINNLSAEKKSNLIDESIKELNSVLKN